MDQALTVAGVIETTILTILGWTFCIAYHVRTGGTWRALPEGRHLMRFTLILSVTFTFTLLFALLVPVVVTVTVALVIQALVFAALIAELGNRLRLMLQGNHSEDRK